MFLKILQYPQENICVGVYYEKETPAQVFSCKYCEFSKNSFFNRTPPVAASNNKLVLEAVFIYTILHKNENNVLKGFSQNFTSNTKLSWAN